MIVKNEEKVLKRCLDSLSDIADEIIIADTGSSDSTKEIASLYTNKIYDFKWTGDFAKARNFVASKATKEYIYISLSSLNFLSGSLENDIGFTSYHGHE